MKKSRFSEHEIMQILKQAEGEIPVPELRRQHGMSPAIFISINFISTTIIQVKFSFLT